MGDRRACAGHDTGGGLMTTPLTVRVAVAGDDLAYARSHWERDHYLHRFPDPRSRTLVYVVTRDGEPVGALGVNRPEASTTRPLFGSLADLAAGLVARSYWSVVNLCRVWLSPDIQRGGRWYIPNAATWAIGQVRRRCTLDYLLAYPPVACEQPYTLDLMISYCATAQHQGTIYRAAGFTLARTNKRGLQTWTHLLRPLRARDDARVRLASLHDPRAQAHRARRACPLTQLPLLCEVA